MGISDVIIDRVSVPILIVAAFVCFAISVAFVLCVRVVPAAATYRCNIILLCVQRNVIKIDDTFVHYFVCSQLLTSREQGVILLLVLFTSLSFL